MNRAHLWRSKLGQRMAAGMTPTEYERFSRWMIDHAITEEDLVALVRQWWNARHESESLVGYLQRIEWPGVSRRATGGDSPNGSRRIDSAMLTVGS